LQTGDELRQVLFRRWVFKPEEDVMNNSFHEGKL
jgi:hypothetical protein